MTDDELIARLRGACYLAFDDGTNDYGTAPDAADRIEALVKESAEMEAEAHAHIELWGKALREKAAAEARVKRLEAALEHYACDCDPNSDICTSAGGSNGCGGIARAALKGADHE